MTKEEIKKIEKLLIQMIEKFCEEKLDLEYTELCVLLTKKLGRKRDVPFQRGKIEIWAAAIIHAIGSINFLFDDSFQPYIKATEISDYFGAKNATVSGKSSEIKKMLNLSYYDAEFSTIKMNGSNPFNNLVMVDGFIVSLDTLPQELQNLVKEKRAMGSDIEFTTK